MITVRVLMKTSHEPLKRTPVTVVLDALQGEARTERTDRLGVRDRWGLTPRGTEGKG